MTQAISGPNATTFMGELAVLLIENDSNRAESDRLQRDNARATFLQDAQHQVDALHAAADATASGALIGAAFAVSSGAYAIGAANSQYDADLGKAKSAPGCQVATDQLEANIGNANAKLFGSFGEAGEALFGDVRAQNFQSDAKRFETLGAQAQWQASDASSDADKADKQSDKAIDALQSTQRDQAQANNAIIGRI